MMRLVWCSMVLLALAGEARAQVRFVEWPGSLEIRSMDQRVAEFVTHDSQIHRPFFAHLQAPGRIQVSRNYPPHTGKEPDDHAAMHPGAWLAFGDIGGNDTWRNRAIVRVARSVEPPQAQADRGSFAVKIRYFSRDIAVFAEEDCRYELRVLPDGYLLTSASEFRAIGKPFAFGDQEEMGFGVRVATSISVKKGGRMVNSLGGVDEKGIWGKAADWCAATGTVDGQRVGVVLMADPRNFRKSWFHARDYGLMVANPFGRKALTGGPESRVEVKPGEVFRLGFGLYLGRGEVDGAKAFREYIR